MSTNKKLRNSITNVEDLLNEIDRISALKDEQEAYLEQQYHLLKYKIDTPARLISRLTARVPGISQVRAVVSSIGVLSTKTEKSDWLTNVLRLATPLVLNRTLLRNAGWVKKTILTLASETAVSRVNQHSVSHVFSGIAHFIRPKKRKIKSRESMGTITAEEAVEGNKYGIPRDSEAY